LAEEKQRKEELAAREALIDSLVLFAEAVGHFSVDRSERRVRLALGDQWFEIDASEPEVRVEFEGAAAYVPELTRNSRLGSPWMLWAALFRRGAGGTVQYRAADRGSRRQLRLPRAAVHARDRGARKAGDHRGRGGKAAR